MPADLSFPDKAEWQKLKNTHKVPKHIGKAGIGEQLDKIHKLAVDSWFKTIPPCQAVLKSLKDYKTALTASKDPAALKFVAIVDKQVEDKIEAHIKRVTSLKQQVIDAPGMAQKCGEVLKAAQPLKEKPEALQKKVTIIQQMLGAVYTSAEVLKKAGLSGDWDKILTFIRDVTKKMNDLDLHCTYQIKKPVPLPQFKEGWDKRAITSATLCKSISDTFAAEMK